MTTTQPSGYSADNGSRRVAELEKQKDRLLKQVKAHRAPSDGKLQIQQLQDRRPDIQQALGEFQQFFEGYFAYFSTPEVIAQYTGQLTREQVLTTALERMREAWMLLSWAINQRTNPLYEDDFAVADRKAEELYHRFRPRDPQKRPIIYFDKFAQITFFPYQSFPLVALPLDRPDDWGALAHELGHYFFWNNGQLKDYRQRIQTLRAEIAAELLADGMMELEEGEISQLRIWLSWAEETFADIFGTLLLGPVYAKSAQDLQVRERLGTLRDLRHDDGRHPMSDLRPLISIAVLKVIAEHESNLELNSVIQKLEERWRPYQNMLVDFEPEDNNHHHEQMVKGINFITALYPANAVSWPVNYHRVAKTEGYSDKKTGRQKRRWPVTKNEIYRQLLRQVVGNQIPFRSVLNDGCYASADTMLFIKHDLRRDFIMPLKSHRKVVLSLEDKQQGR